MTFMSSPKRAAKPAASRTNGKRAGKATPHRQSVTVAAKPAGNGASVDAKRLAAALERSIADGKRITARRRPRCFRARHVAELDRTMMNHDSLVPAKAGA